jgi:formamidopyrimidine-DNA glycosylase
MPELPEVENVRRGLERVLAGRVITRVEQRRKDLRFPFPARFKKRIEGRTIVSLGRRAKYLLAFLDSGDTLVMHLGMSGRFTIAEQSSIHQTIGNYEYGTGANPAHDHVVFETANGAIITYNDPRRFGFMLLMPERQREHHPLFFGLGAEPLGGEFDAAYLAQIAARRRCDLKALLMDQRVVAGLGNIYVSEALHRARLWPKRPARTISQRGGAPTEAAERLVAEIRLVLEAAIRAGGSTLRDYRQADGSAGDFQNAFVVYGREGEPCLTPGCGGIVRRSIQSGRSTYFCRSCQK